MVTDTMMLTAEQALEALREAWKSPARKRVRSTFNRWRREGRCPDTFTFAVKSIHGWSYRPVTDDVVVRNRGGVH